VGSVGQLCGNELSSILNGNSGLHIPYKEYGQWFTDVINQTLVLSCTTFGSSMPYYQGKKLQYIAVTGNKRHPLYPELPTLNELLKRNIVIPDGWVGVFVKKSTDPAIVAKIESDFLESATSDEIKKTMESSHLVTTSSMNAREFSKFLKTSTEEYKYLIKKFNITVN
jgi:tripartite-type tricarboxylate transporter receptor subunit TctC